MKQIIWAILLLSVVSLTYFHAGNDNFISVAVVISPEGTHIAAYPY